MSVIFKRIWNSPTITTWFSYSTKALSLFVVLPLVLKKFSSGDIVLWYLFFTIISLQSIADFGFRQTFSRIISYAFGGATDIGTFGTSQKRENTVAASNAPNISLLNGIVSNMRYIYFWLTIIVFILMGLFGTWAMSKPVSESSNIHNSWVAWVIVLFVSCISFYGKIYMNFLEGLFKIALVRRIEMLTSLGSIFSSILVMIWSPTLLNMVIVNQLWVVIITLRDLYLCKTVDNKFYKLVSKKLPFDKALFSKIWKPAWRSGLSSLMSVGLTNLTGLAYAQVGDTNAVAAYLLALRIINQIRDISMAPFYSKLPLLAILRVKGDVNELVRISKKGMFLSHMSYMIAFVFFGIFSQQLLLLIHSKIPFVSQPMWLLLGCAFFIHRYGAMHMQVYLSTNHIISHIADIVSGCCFIVSSLVLVRYTGIFAIPLGMLVGYLGFYAWYAAMFSYRSINLSFWNFEKNVLAVPLLLFAGYVVFCFTLLYKG